MVFDRIADKNLLLPAIDVPDEHVQGRLWRSRYAYQPDWDTVQQHLAWYGWYRCGRFGSLWLRNLCLRLRCLVINGKIHLSRVVDRRNKFVIQPGRSGPNE